MSDDKIEDAKEKYNEVLQLHSHQSEAQQNTRQAQVQYWRAKQQLGVIDGRQKELLQHAENTLREAKSGFQNQIDSQLDQAKGHWNQSLDDGVAQAPDLNMLYVAHDLAKVLKRMGKFRAALDELAYARKGIQRICSPQSDLLLTNDWLQVSVLGAQFDKT